jgi:hypothetical protein
MARCHAFGPRSLLQRLPPNGELQPRSDADACKRANYLSRSAQGQHPPPTSPKLDGRVVSWSRQDSRARDRLLETGERRARAFALDVFPRTRALNPPPSRRRGFAFDASSPPRTAGSCAPTVQAPRPHRRRDMGASQRRARAALAFVAFLAIFPRVAFAAHEDLTDDLCGNTNGARLPRPARLPAQNRSPRDATSHTFLASSHRRAARRAISARAPPSRVSSAHHLPHSLARPSSLGSRPSVLVPRFSSLGSRPSFLFPHPSSLLLTPRPPSLAPQIGTARRRTGSSARTTSRRRALPKRSTAT